MVLATTAVAVVPAVSAWWLREHGVLRSALASLLFCVLLSVGLSIIGAAYWKRRRRSADIMFSELLVWGWARRLWRERQLRNVPALVQSAGNGDHADQATVERRKRMLGQLAAAIEAQDPYIDGHSRRVARHCAMIATQMNLPAEQVARIRTAGALHDVGKLRTPSAVLAKPGPLTDEEFEVVKRHAREGALMVTCLEDPELTAMVECHHERLDGSGYPDGLEAEEIPLGARIVAVADIFDAVTAPRPYRPAAPHQRAFAILDSEEGTRLDPAVVRAFHRCYSGRGTVALWAALTAPAATALAQSKGLLARRRLSLRDLLGTTTAVTAAAAAAAAAPLISSAPPRLLPHRLLSSVPSAAPSIVSAPVHKARISRHHGRQHTAVSPRKPATAPQLVPQHRAAAAPPHPRPAQVTRNTPSLHASRPTTTPTQHRPPPSTPPTRKPPSPPTISKPPPPVSGTPTPAPPPSTPPPGPTTKAQCMHGGYESLGFPNQGQCITWVVHHGG